MAEPMFDVPLQVDVPLEGALDVEAIVASFPPSYTVKGMFCNRFTELLGRDFEGLVANLAMPPRGGRYVPFKNYPQADYTRLSVATAAKLFPERSLREGLRRVARDDFRIFAASMFGKIVLAVAGDARATLLRVPVAYEHVAPGPAVRAEELDAATVRVVFERYHGIVEYLVGQFEGVVLAFGHTPRVIVRKLADATLAFDVRHLT